MTQKKVSIDQQLGQKKGLCTRKPILPSQKELEENSRAGSAKLRVFERAAQDSPQQSEG